MDFITCINNLSPYISQYYEYINFAPDCERNKPPCQLTLFNFLTADENQKHKLLIVTDGGVIPAQGSIGFVLCDEKGKCFLECWGQPSGIDPKSFRAEICSQLAATRLI